MLVRACMCGAHVQVQHGQEVRRLHIKIIPYYALISCALCYLILS